MASDDGVKAEVEDTEDADTGESDSTDIGEPIDPSEFTTLELTLEEARRHYDDEERRRDTVESKIGIVVTVDALLISFAALFNQGSGDGFGIHPLALTLVLLPALVSAGYGLYTIRSRDYDRPGKPIMDFHDYSEYENNAAQREQLLLDYELTTNRNQNTNDKKFTVFNRCILLTILTMALLVAAPVIAHFGIATVAIALIFSILASTHSGVSFILAILLIAIEALN